MSLADYVLHCHGILESMTSENQRQQMQQPRLNQKLVGKWMDLRLGNTLRISQPDGGWSATEKPCLPGNNIGRLPSEFCSPAQLIDISV